MDKILKTLGWTFGLGFVTVLVLGFMAITGTGFGIIEGHEIGVKKEGTTYIMEEYKPGYYFYAPIYSTLEDVNGRPVMFNWSKSDANKKSTDEMRYYSMITGVDKNGIPLSFALAMEITPEKSMMAEMFQETGSYENAMDKKAIQPSKSLIKDVMGSFEAKDIQGQRNEVSKMLNSKLSEFYKNNKYFNLDSRIDLKEIEVPQKIRDKQIAVQTAVQDAKISEQLILKAQNEAKAVEAKAEGEANANIIRAKGIAKSNKLIGQSLTENILKNNAIEQWNGVTPTIVGSDNSQFIYKLK